jgi:Protein of unknown function (DUF2950)
MTNRKVTVLFLSAMMSACGAFAQSSAQPAFHSAAEASQSLFEAAQNHDVQAAANILGVSTDVVTTNDDAQDKADRETFAAKYQQMHRLRREADGTVTLYVGAENWPFPFPLLEKDGLWRFDSDAGAKEIVYRRVGRNEFAAIAVCHKFVAARKQKAAPTQDLGSSPLSSLITSASSSQPVLIQGYYFRVLVDPQSAGFTLIAYPAAYRSSGAMTFVVTEKNVVYEKDLGSESTSLGSTMSRFRKDATWNNAEAGK